MNAKIYTIEQIKNMGTDEYVFACAWLECPCTAIEAIIFQPSEKGIYFIDHWLDEETWSYKSYNDRWRLWKEKPNDEERKAEKWSFIIS